MTTITLRLELDGGLVQESMHVFDYADEAAHVFATLSDADNVRAEVELYRDNILTDEEADARAPD